jgi:ABC-type cobalamin/Fe3+-siderophores transport system ATPase subunit
LGIAIELRHVTVVRGDRTILKNVNLLVPTGSCCAILVTHHLDELPRSVDRVVLLKQGKVFDSGSPDRVLTSDHLSRLFDCRVKIVRQDGRFVASATHGTKSWT